MSTVKRALVLAASLVAFSVAPAQAAGKTGENSDSAKTSTSRSSARDELDFFAAPRTQSPPQPSIFTGNVKSFNPPPPASTSSSTSSSGEHGARKAD